jgi:hypothetical protein
MTQPELDDFFERPANQAALLAQCFESCEFPSSVWIELNRGQTASCDLGRSLGGELLSRLQPGERAPLLAMVTSTSQVNLVVAIPGLDPLPDSWPFSAQQF